MKVMTMNKIGFVGLGSMGAPLAGRLLAGNQVYGTNRTRAKASALIEQGLIDPGLAARAMTGSAIGSPMLQARAPLVLDLPEQAWFDVQLMHKDIRLALQAGRQAKVPLPAASAADSALSRAEELGYGHRDIAGLFQALAQTAAAAAAGPGTPVMNAAGDGPKAA
jgi:3-hydroxyisobutyrate dehydrogenase-like beta-hydroxyacid dehydrogenase